MQRIEDPDCAAAAPSESRRSKVMPYARNTVVEHPFEAAFRRRSHAARAADLLGSTRESAALVEDSRVRAITQALRQTLSDQNVRESNLSDEEGYYFVVEGPNEVSVHYNTVQPFDSRNGSSLRRIQLAFMRCCEEMTGRGYTVSLFMSPRAHVLFVSD